jgi:hypothetical protein
MLALVLTGCWAAAERARGVAFAGLAVGRLGDVSSFVVAFGVDDPAASAGRDA